MFAKNNGHKMVKIIRITELYEATGETPIIYTTNYKGKIAMDRSNSEEGG
jgi:hypothetical protein